jgi:tryptophan synthase alpha chain
MKISEVFANAKKNKEKLFIPFIVAGDPNVAVTGDFLVALENAGASIIEIGIPFSDPVADGPTIQRASQRALLKNTSLSEVLDLVRRLRASKALTVPIVLFSYLNPIFKMGLEEFSQKAERSGINGVLIVDLPPEEAEEHIEKLGNHNIETIFLASPTTSESRLKLIDKSSTGFVYYVSRLGVTGVQKDISGTLSGEIEHLRNFIKKPIAIGFGISTAAQAKTISLYADAVVVGGALVELIEKNLDPGKASAAISKLATDITTALS